MWSWPGAYCRECWMIGTYLAVFPMGGLLATLAVALAVNRGRFMASAVACALGLLMLTAAAVYSVGITAKTPSMEMSIVAILAGAALLGASLQGMLIGHAYLVASKMPIRVLINACRWLIALVLLRTALAGAGFAAWWFGWSGAQANPGQLEMMTWVFIVTRALFGLIAPPVLGWMALASARIRSTQSATGILYPVLVLVSMGELCFLYLLTGYGVVL
jgi:hypothetical protein